MRTLINLLFISKLNRDPEGKPSIYLEWTQLEENTREGVAPD